MLIQPSQNLFFGVRFLNGACKTKVKSYGQETVVGTCLAGTLLPKVNFG